MNTLTLTIIVALTFTGLSAISSGKTDLDFGNDYSGSLSLVSPEDTVRAYVDSRCDRESAKRKNLLTAMPDDYLVKRADGDTSILLPEIQMPDGMKSIAELKRPMYLEWLNREFPKMLCGSEQSFGRITDSLIYTDRAEITHEFQFSDGTMGFTWTFFMLNENNIWKIYDLDPPER